MDIRELVEGTTLYLPVFVEGALLWSGDSHAAQGNGEINLTASLATDARVGDMRETRKSVHCVVPKSLWVGGA
jgi:acetamidase/formamidase